MNEFNNNAVNAVVAMRIYREMLRDILRSQAIVEQTNVSHFVLERESFLSEMILRLSQSNDRF